MSSTAVDFESIKKKQQATWSTGDYAAIAARIVFCSELLCETADLQAGWRVLDVATGPGSAAIAAARRGCEAVGLDYVPRLLERARAHAAAEGLEAQFVEGDAEKLPYPGESFDAVLSVFGVMFAPDHQRAAAELARVCRPGGRIALACWTPDGFAGEMFKLAARYLPPPPGLSPPTRWGSEAYQSELLGGSAQLHESRVRAHRFKHRSAEEFVGFFRTHFGPTMDSAPLQSMPGGRSTCATVNQAIG